MPPFNNLDRELAVYLEVIVFTIADNIGITAGGKAVRPLNKNGILIETVKHDIPTGTDHRVFICRIKQGYYSRCPSCRYF